MDVAFSSGQVDQYGLPPVPGKASDSRASGFVERHGRLVQVELEALDPDVLRSLYRRAFDEFFDTSQYEAMVAREDGQRDILRDALSRLEGAA